MAIFPILLLLVILITIPGIVMGWIAAGRIRRSDGKLYGMGFAAFAALFYPILLLFAIPFIVCAILIRFAAFNDRLDEETALIMIFPVIITGLIFSFKFARSLYRSVTEGEPIIAGVLPQLNRMTVIIVILIWLCFGGFYAAGLFYTVKPPTPRLEPPTEARVTVTGLSFQPEHEMKIPFPRSGSRTSFLDLDTRKFMEGAAVHSLTTHRFNSVASKPAETDQKIEAWASDYGADLMIIQIKPKVLTALYGGPMTYQPALDYDLATPTQVLEAAKFLPETSPSGKDQPHVTLFGPKSGEAIVFRTREGGVGLLELQESPEHPRGGLIVRYKTIRETH